MTASGAAPAGDDDTGRARSGTVAGMVAELSELTSLILSTDALDKVVWEAAMLAVHAIEEVDACGVTVLRDGAPLSILPETAPFGRLEDYQYRHEVGPVLETLTHRRSVVTTAADAARRWPGYAEVADELAVSCSLVMPLTVGDEVLGALSLYSTATGGDLTSARNLGELVADLASTALSCMARHAEKTRLTEELRQALLSRAVIEQAKGALMVTRGLTADDAFGLLRRTSQNHNIKLRDVASIVVDTQGRPPTGPT